jgi:hypothetical protein
MGLQAELGCPQCGAPVALDEADRLVTCPFCKVTTFLAAQSYHFVLPPKERGEELVFAPYLRCKGVVYCATATEIVHRIADVTSRGVPMAALPISLGVRPQAMRLCFAEPGMGSYLKNSATVEEAIAGVTRALTLGAGGVRHLCMIGESISRIYLPIAVRGDQAYDAVSGDLLGRLPTDRDLFAQVRDPGFNWQPQALAALCPQCGWNLEGDPASVVLICRQCDSAWQAAGTGYGRVEVSGVAVKGVGAEADGMSLPFWRMEVEAGQEGACLRTRAAFARLGGHPSARTAGGDEPYALWSPAFKVRPKIFLQAARQLTTSQPRPDEPHALPRTIQPVTLPLSEAAEAIPLILVSAASRQRELLALLPGLTFRVTRATLVFIPFQVTFHDYVQPELQMSINRKAMEFGSAL